MPDVLSRESDSSRPPTKVRIRSHHRHRHRWRDNWRKAPKVLKSKIGLLVLVVVLAVLSGLATSTCVVGR